MGFINYFSYATGSACVHGLHLLFQLCYWGQPVFMGYINYFSYVTGVGMCSWVTLTISVMLLGSACVHGLH